MYVTSNYSHRLSGVNTLNSGKLLSPFATYYASQFFNTVTSELIIFKKKINHFLKNALNLTHEFLDNNFKNRFN